MNNPALYHLSNSLQRSDATVYLEDFKSKMKWKKGTIRVIDIGCGDGSVTNILMNYLPDDFKLLASDVNVNMVNFANDKNHNPKISFKVLDIGGQIPKELKSTFDHLFSFYALHWVQDHMVAFKNVFDLLDEGGYCFTIFLGANSYHKFLRTMSQISKWKPWTQDVEKYISPYYDSKDPEKEIKQLIESIGFVDYGVECTEKVFLYDDMEVFKNHFFAINPLKIPDDMIDDYYDNYVQMLQQLEIEHNVENSSDRIHFYYNIIKVYAHKPKSIE